MKKIMAALARWHIHRYCKLMSYVVGENIDEDEVYKRLIKK